MIPNRRARAVWRSSCSSVVILRSEFEIENSNGKATLSYVDDKGFGTWRIDAVEIDGIEVVARISSKVRNESEILRFVPREPAADLRVNIELARLQKANEIAEIFTESEPGIKLLRVSLNVENGRIAQIEIEDRDKKRTGLMADVTSSVTHASVEK